MSASPAEKQPAAPSQPAKAPKAPAEKPKEKGAGLSPVENRMVASINDYRADHQLAPLTADPLLQRIARARVGVFNHNHPRFGWVWSHARREGFPGQALNTTCTDDLCQGAPSPEEAVNGWAHSTVGHAEQMLGKAKMNGVWQDCKFNLCGVAKQGQNYIAVFGRREDIAQTTAGCDCCENCTHQIGCDCKCAGCKCGIYPSRHK